MRGPSQPLVMTYLCDACAALQAQRIRGAALDVFAAEPLRPDSVLWRLPNVLISPHCADQTATFQHSALLQWVQNLRRFSHHQLLINVVNKQLGY